MAVVGHDESPRYSPAGIMDATASNQQIIPAKRRVELYAWLGSRASRARCPGRAIGVCS
jgi:hypothetical protein